MIIHGMKGEYTKVNGINMFYMHGGTNKEQPLVLVHGLFQTGMMWRRVAEKLMENHYVVIPDVRGYGLTDKPDSMEAMTKKVQAKDIYELTQQLGLKKFVLLSHDRGARVSRTYAIDYPQTLLGLSIMDMVPTEYIYQEMTTAQTGPHHWDQLFKLASPMAEDLLVGDKKNIETYVNNFYKRTPGFIELLKEDGVYDYYMDCIQSQGAMMAVLNDYRAAFHIDTPRLRASLEKGERITAPTQILWGSKGNASRSPIMDIWRARCSNTVEGSSVPSGHYLAEEEPEITGKLLLEFVEKCYQK